MTTTFETYEEFKKEYVKTLKDSLKYSIEQAGSSIFCSKLSDITEAVPIEWVDLADSEIEQRIY